MIASGLVGALAAEIIVIALAALLLYIIYKIGKSLLKVILGIIINSALGIGIIYFADLFFGLGIQPFAIYYFLPLAIFGLPAAGTIILLKFFSVIV